MKSAARSSLSRIVAMAIAMAVVLCIGCKRSSSSSPAAGGNTASGDGTPGGATATGSGAVNVSGNVVTYQNVHVEVPWNVSDVAELVRISQEAASGAGLTLKNGNKSLSIASDGRSIRLNGHDCGALKPGDHVVLSNDGKLRVNDVERWAEPAPGGDGSIHVTVGAGTESTLTHGSNTLQITANGTAIRLNRRAYGAVRPGDHVTLTADGKLMINGVERLPDPATPG
jgi:hypothetical protein